MVRAQHRENGPPLPPLEAGAVAALGVGLAGVEARSFRRASFFVIIFKIGGPFGGGLPDGNILT